MGPSDVRDTGHALFRLFGIALAAWAIASLTFIGWYFLTPRDASLADIAVPFVAWAYGYPAGGAVLVAAGLVLLAAGRLRGATVIWALAVYLCPAAVLAALLWLPAVAAPLTGAESDAGGRAALLVGPALVMLYAAGLAAAYSSRDRSVRRTATAIVAPPVAGLLLLAAWTGITLARTPELQDRRRLAFAVERAELVTDGLVADAIVTLSKPGRYEFQAHFVEPDATWQRAHRIVWLDGEPEEPGRYRCRLEWTALESRRDSDPAIVLEVRAATEALYDPPVARLRVLLERVVTASSRLVRVQSAGGWGLADTSGRLVVPPAFDEIGFFGEGLFPVRQGRRWGYIDERGGVVIPPRFVRAESFSEGLAAAAVDDERGEPLYGYIDRRGVFTIPPRFLAAYPFVHGTARVYLATSTDGLEARIDVSGRVQPPR